MKPKPIPIVVLAGSDRKAAELPEQGRDKHPLVGFKAVDVRIGGRTMIETVVGGLRAGGWFDPIYIAGPRRIYADFAGPAEIVDTDDSFGQNVRASVERFLAEHSAGPMAVTVCDIVPDRTTLDRLMTEYQKHGPTCDIWFPMVRSPERGDQLGESAWKPKYRIIPAADAPPVFVLPGHLIVADPRALRLKLLYRLIDLGYSTRNRPIDQRRDRMVRGVLADMLYQDLKNAMRLRAPTFTWSVLRAAIPASNLLREGAMTQGRLEQTLRKVLVKVRHRRAHPERRVMLPIVDALFLARDIDTEEEAQDLGGEVRH